MGDLFRQLQAVPDSPAISHFRLLFEQLLDTPGWSCVPDHTIGLRSRGEYVVGGRRIEPDLLTQLESAVERIRDSATIKQVRVTNMEELLVAGGAKRGKTDRSSEKRGPKKKTPLLDVRVEEAWITGRYPTYAELGRELGCSTGDVKKALDRRRKGRKSGSP